MKKNSEIKLARHIGFCFGVQRAVKMAEAVLESGAKGVYTLGQIIHNPQTVERLRQRGLKVVTDLNKIKSGTLIVCSHGIDPSVLKRAQTQGVKIVDATCPLVKKAQEIVRYLKEDNYTVIIVGDKNHPEVKAMAAIAGRDVVIVENNRDARLMKLRNRKIGIIAQTTQRHDNYKLLIEQILKNRFWNKKKLNDKINLYEVRIFDTICDATLRRQEAAKSLAGQVELMLVVGGRMSANTSRLAQACRLSGVPTYHIESARDVRAGWRRGYGMIGIASGTSTPDCVINEVVEALKNKEDSPKGARRGRS